MAVINGTAGADTINGTTDPDTINGLAGNDLINGLAGNDIIQGGAGDDTIDGGTGVDTLIGGADNDQYLVDDANDQVIENTGEGNDLVLTTVSYTLGGAQEVEILRANSSAGAINLTGNELANRLEGNNSSNTLDGGVDTLADTLVGGLGDDTYLVRSAVDSVLENAGQGFDRVFSVGSFTLGAGQEIEYLSAADQGGSGALTLVGNEFAQVIAGNQGANILSGSTTSTAGADTLIGLGGDDDYHVVSATQVVTETAGQGNDIVRIGYVTGGGTTVAANAGTYSITGDVETITAAASAGVTGINIVGSAISQSITGNDANNILNGNGGNDTLDGGAGNDTYIVDGGDTIVDSGGALDTVISSFPITLASGVGIEALYATGSVRFTASGAGASGFGITTYGFDTVDGTRNLNAENSSAVSVAFLNGNETAQTITGNASDNILDGNRNANVAADGTPNTGAGFADTLSGLAGNDTYRVYEQNDIVLEDRNGGRDSVFTSATYSLAVNDTNATAYLNAAFTNGATEFFGSGGVVNQIEVLSTAVNSGTDAIDLTGNAYGQVIVGNYGVNTITGGGTSAGGGTDVLIGLNGNDIYVVDSVNSVIFEQASEGVLDTANVTVSGFTLNTGSNVEVLNATYADGGAGFALVGNELAQQINGGSGADTLAGGGGNDTLAGGAGNDVYRVADNNVTITETAGNGTFDQVFTVGISYQLAAAANIEYLSTTAQGSSENINFTGNQLAQVIAGNYGNNVLDSGQAAVTGTGIYAQAGDLTVGDTMIGLVGNDTYRVYSQNDVVVEAAGQGTDVISTSASYSLAANNAATYNGGSAQSIETLRVDSSVGASAAISLTGDGQANTLVGHAGQNTLDGGLGNDTLTGGAGSDSFQFSTALGSGNVDTITDFQAGDLIRVSTGIFTAVAGGYTADNFVVGTAAADGNDYFVYNQTTGQLFYDADGNGTASSAVLFAQLTAGTALGFNDIVTYTPPAA